MTFILSNISIVCFSPLLLPFISLELQGQNVKPLEQHYPALIRKVEFRTFTTKDGLTANHFRGRLLVDRHGYIWAGTFDGLNRFDGYKFENFRSNPLDSNSLSGSGVYAIHEDHQGTIWLGTSTVGGQIGLHHFDQNTKTVYRHTNELYDSTVRGFNIINCIYEDQRKSLWVGSIHGLYEVRSRSNSRQSNLAGKQRLYYVKYSHDPRNPSSLANDSVLSIREDAEHALWIRTRKGVNRLDTRTGSMVRFREEPRVPQSLVGKFINEVYEDRSGVLWICTTEGLYMVEKNSDNLSHFKLSATDHRSLSDNHVYTVHQDMGGTIWVGTSAGLNEFDPSLRRFTRHLPNANVISIAEDQAENLWVGTNGGGLSQLTKRARELKSFTLAGHESARLYITPETSEGGLWVNTLDADSIVFLDSTMTTRARRFEGPDFEIMLAGNHGELWFATSGKGLLRWDKTGAISQLNHGGASERRNDVWFFYRDSERHLWLTGNDGLIKFDPNSRTVLKHYKHNPSDSTSISSNSVNNLIEDGHHIFWVGTNGSGLNRFDPLTEKFTRWTHNPVDATTLSSSVIQGLVDGKDGSLWVGTSLGVNRFDKRIGRAQRFFRGNGTLSNYAFQILRDRTGNVWVGYSNNGFSKLDVRTGGFTTFTARDGLSAETFNALDCFERQNGEIVLQSAGSVVFHPDRLRPSTFIPPIVLTGFSVFDKSITLWEDSVGYKPITLPFDSNFFAFEFAALDLTVPERNQHAYKLEGYEDNWNYIGNKREAKYTKVPPGEYVFRVKGSNSDGVWNEKGTFINIIITPPWWKTVWAYGSYGLLVVGGLYTLRRYERKRDRLKQQAELDRVESEKRLQQEFSKQLIETQEAERKRVASELHDSLGQHLLIVNNELQMSLQSKQFIESDVQRTVSVVKDAIKEVREIASNLHPHHLEKLGLRAAVEAMIEQISRSASVKFNAAIADVDDKLSMQAKINLYRVLQEAIANIVRHSGATKASITISQTDSTVQTIIEDNGKGFVQSSSQGGRQGFGLKSMTERMNLVGGTITFDSTPGKGTTIQITIPIHY